jgi:hypothetical protein
MRNGKVAARPSGFPDWLKARMERGKEEGQLMTWLKGLPGAQAPFSPFWSSSVKPGQTWSSLVKLGQAWSSLVKPGQTWSSLVKPGQSGNRGLTVKPGRGYEIS